MAYPSPLHPLETVEFRLTVPTRLNEGEASVHIVGRSQTKRTHLWAIGESWPGVDDTYDYSAAEMIHHVALCALSDRPMNRFQLDRSMRGLPVWEQGEMIPGT